MTKKQSMFTELFRIMTQVDASKLAPEVKFSRVMRKRNKEAAKAFVENLGSIN